MFRTPSSSKCLYSFSGPRIPSSRPLRFSNLFQLRIFPLALCRLLCSAGSAQRRLAAKGAQKRKNAEIFPLSLGNVLFEGIRCAFSGSASPSSPCLLPLLFIFSFRLSRILIFILISDYNLIPRARFLRDACERRASRSREQQW